MESNHLLPELSDIFKKTLDGYGSFVLICVAHCWFESVVRLFRERIYLDNLSFGYCI